MTEAARPSGRLAGTVFILGAALVWSVVGLFSKHCLQAGMDPLQCAFQRAFFGFAAFFVHMALAGQFRIPWRHAFAFALFGAWGIGVYFTCAQYTIRLSGAAMDIILQYTAPFWVAVFARLLFGERLTRIKLFCLVLAAAGTVCVCLAGGSIPGEVSWVGIATGLVSGLCYATHYPFTRWWQKTYPSFLIFAWMLFGGCLVMAGVLGAQALWGASPVRTDFAWDVWLASAGTGVVCTYLAYVCLAEALKRISLVQTVVTSELEPVLAMLWVWLAFGECFSPIGWTGSALIIGAVLLMTLVGGDAHPAPSQTREA